MQALTFQTFGGPDVLTWQEVADPQLSPGTALVRTQAVGLNYADVYRRRGDYHLAGQPPYIAGYEAAGVVEAIGEDDGTSLDYRPKVGDRVGFADVPFANAELVAAPFEKLIPLPQTISAEQAASVLLQGLTAHFLVHDSHRLQSGESVLLHAAAGGVLGIASTPAKRAAVLAAGAEQAVATDSDWVASAREFGGDSDGDGVHVAYDSVGITLDRTLDAVRTGGHVVFYGMAGGDPAPVDPRRLMDESKTLTGGDLWNVLSTQRGRIERANALFERMDRGELTVSVARTFPLRDGAEAHRFLESRQAIGKVLLLV